MTNVEMWRDVPSFVDYYVVSDQGRVMRLAGTPRTPANRILKPSVKPEGYGCVDLCMRGRRERHYVHTLVAMAFHGPRPAGMQVNHLDGDKLNNAAGNLAYVTPGDNQRHAYGLGLKPRVGHVGAANPNAKLSEADVERITLGLGRGEPGSLLAQQFGVTRQTISNILTGTRWGSLGRHSMRSAGPNRLCAERRSVSAR